MREQQQGFTLIELVIVIFILGILAAVALPRLLNTADDAHQTVNKGAGGAFYSAVSLVHAAWRVAGGSGTMSDVPGFGDGGIAANAAGWPTDFADNTQIGGVSSRCSGLWDALLTNPPSVSDSSNDFDYRANASGEVCTFVNQADTSLTIVYSAVDGSVTLTP